MQLRYLILFLFPFISYSQNGKHELWDKELIKYVSIDGKVNYKAWKNDTVGLIQYLNYLKLNPPQKNWTKEEQMAYWINAYNAFTVYLILSHYPVKSIKEIGGKIPFVNSSWDIKFIHIGTENLDLNNIEHGKLRKNFNDARIHMALVCASYSCPILRNEAFSANKLNAQLDEQVRLFLNDSKRNQINSNVSTISMIFKWYASDFKTHGGVKSFINLYTSNKLTRSTKLNYMEYNWNLNE